MIFGYSLFAFWIQFIINLFKSYLFTFSICSVLFLITLFFRRFPHLIFFFIKHNINIRFILSLFFFFKLFFSIFNIYYLILSSHIIYTAINVFTYIIHLLIHLYIDIINLIIYIFLNIFFHIINFSAHIIAISQ